MCFDGIGICYDIWDYIESLWLIKGVYYLLINLIESKKMVSDGF